MYTVDASVWGNSFDQRAPGHEVSRALLAVLGAQAIPLFLPTLALPEVAGAISRSRGAPAEAQAFALAMSNLPNVTVTALDAALASRAVSLAAQHGLGCADAVYAAVAAQAGSTLVTLDSEQLTRVSGVIVTQTPSAALAALVPPPRL